MTCEEFLMQYRDAMAEVEDLECQIQFAEGRLQRTTANYDGVKVQGHHDRKDAEAELADLVREKDEAQEAADKKRQEILNFIGKVEPGTGDTGRRHRRILKLYYCDALQWSDICAAIRPLRVRRDGRQVTYKKGAGVSETTIFRARLEALAAADIEFRRLGLG